jgi:hypothetical protein
MPPHSVSQAKTVLLPKRASVRLPIDKASARALSKEFISRKMQYHLLGKGEFAL